jgi:c-di-GMP-binding flagellar brake protein YcgR
MTENRRFQRVTVNFSVAFRTQDTGETTGKVCNLSLGGMKVSLPLPSQMPPDPDLWYDVSLPEPFSKLSGSGRIRWQQADPETQRLWLGLEFASLSVEQISDLEHIIGELQGEK